MGAGRKPGVRIKWGPGFRIGSSPTPSPVEIETCTVSGKAGLNRRLCQIAASRAALPGFNSRTLQGMLIALPALLERQDAFAFVEQRGRERGAGRQHGHEPVAEGIGVLKIVGLEKRQRALINIARIGRSHHLMAEEGRALLGLLGDQQHGHRRRHLAPGRIQDPGRMPGDGRPPSSRMATCRIRHCHARK